MTYQRGVRVRESSDDVLVSILVEVESSAIERAVLVTTGLDENGIATSQHVFDHGGGSSDLVGPTRVETELGVARSNVENRELSGELV
jgi:hypothetical protein